MLDEVFEGDLHVKRVGSLANATLGVMTSASLAVAVVGQALAQARGLLTKHAVKQVDRLLSNQGIVVWDAFAYWVPHVVGESKNIVVAMDWTDFDPNGQTTLVLSLVTNHGRAMPLLWLTVRKDELKETRRRKPRHGPPSPGQYRQAPDALPVSSGLHALRTDPEYAGSSLATADRTLCGVHDAI